MRAWLGAVVVVAACGGAAAHQRIVKPSGVDTFNDVKSALDTLVLVDDYPSAEVKATLPALLDTLVQNAKPEHIVARDEASAMSRALAIGDALVTLSRIKQTNVPPSVGFGLNIALESSARMVGRLPERDAVARAQRLVALLTTLDANNIRRSVLRADLFDFGDVDTSHAAVDDASSRLTQIASLLQSAHSLGLPDNVTAALERERVIASGSLGGDVDKLAANHDYVRAITTAQEQAKLDLSGRMSARAAALAAEAATYYMAEAQKVPAGFRHALLTSLARAYGGPANDDEVKALAETLAPRSTVVPTLRSSTGDCSNLMQALSSHVWGTGDGARVPLELKLDCGLNDKVVDLNSTFPYVTQVHVHRTETRYRKEEQYVNKGDYTYECSKRTEFGTTAVGTCSTPAIDKVMVDVPYEVEIDTIEDQNGTQPYVGHFHTVTAGANGPMSITIEDGFVAKVDLYIDGEAQGAQWSFDYPGRMLNDRPRHEEHALPTDLASRATQTAAALIIDREYPKLVAMIAAHRAEIARNQASAAAARSDEAGAAELFIKSAMYGEVKGDAEAWLQKTYGLTADQALTILVKRDRLYVK